jgi:hypothetical protein
MEIKRNIAIALGWLVFSCNVAVAGQMYSIDPAQSWVSAYVANWTAYSYTPPYLTGPGAPPPPTPTVFWNLDWTLEQFQLSGTFQGAAVIDPWAPMFPGWGTLAITNASLQIQLPGYLPAFILPNGIVYTLPGGSIDPCGGPFVGSCGFSGGALALEGTFNGGTLKLIGTSFVAIRPPMGQFSLGGVLIANPGPPPHLDYSPAQWGGYQVVANAVPEPGTLPLIFLGIVALYQAHRRKLSS